MAKAQTESEPDLAHRIRTLQAAIDEKRARFSEMTERRKGVEAELAESEANFKDEQSALQAELGDALTENDTVRQVKIEKLLFNQKNRLLKQQNTIAAFQSALNKIRDESSALSHEKAGLEREYWQGLYNDARGKLPDEQLILTWGLSVKAGIRSDNLGEFYGRVLCGAPGASVMHPSNVPGLTEKLEALSP